LAIAENSHTMTWVKLDVHVIRSRLWRSINLFTYLRTYLSLSIRLVYT